MAKARARVIRFGAAVGARLAEVRRLTWADVNLTAGYVTLRSRKGGRTLVKRIHLSNYAAQLLRNPGEAGEYVFLDSDGTPFDSDEARSRLVQWFIKVCRKAVGWGSVKVLRTTLGSNAEDAGVSIRSAQKALGHTSIKTTERHYLRSQADQTRPAVEAFADFLMDTPTDTVEKKTLETA